MKYKKTALLMILAVGGVSLVFMFGFNAPPGKTGEPPQTAITPSGPEQTVPKPEDAETVLDDHLAITEPEPEPVPEPEGPEMASAHFEMAEFCCDCTGYCDGWPASMAPELLEKVEALRCALDQPVIITSGVRCEARNAEVGGIENSWHMYGHAADLYCPGIPYTEVARVARTLGLGVIEYPGQAFDHVEIWN